MEGLQKSIRNVTKDFKLGTSSSSSSSSERSGYYGGGESVSALSSDQSRVLVTRAPRCCVGSAADISVCHCCGFGLRGMAQQRGTRKVALAMIRSCYSIELRDNHLCVENSMKNYCPIYFEYLFDSVKSTRILKCGHSIHEECCVEMAKKQQYRCPLCSKYAFDMSSTWELLNEECANYLDIKNLLDLVCKTVAEFMKGKTIEEIRSTFNIKSDFTREEEKFCKENALAFE